MDSAREGLLSRGPQQQQQHNGLGYLEDDTPIQTPPPLYSSDFQDNAFGQASNQHHNHRPAGRLGGINFSGWQRLPSVPDGEGHGNEGQHGKENPFRDQDPSFDARKNRPNGIYVSKLRPWSSWWNLKHLPWKSLGPLVLCFACESTPLVHFCSRFFS